VSGATPAPRFADPSAYASVLAIGVPAALAAAEVTKGADLLPGLPVFLAVHIVVLVAALVLWLRCTTWSRSTPVRIVLGAIAVLWLLITVLALARDPGVEPEIVVVLASMALLAGKPPGPVSARRVADNLCWALVAIVALTVLLEATGLVRSPYADITVETYDRSEYWLPISHLLHIDGRWAGPFIHPNRAGPIGAFLLVYGVTRRGPSRVVFAAIGLLVLLLASSRTAWIGAAAGLAALVIGAWLSRPRSRRQLWLAAGAAVAFGVVVLAVVARNPGLTGRTGVWPEYLALFRESPWTGTGTRGILTAIDTGALPGWAAHAHNTYIDMLARNGVFAFVIALAILGYALVVAVQGARAGSQAGLGLVAMILVASLGHTIVAFANPEVLLWVLVLAVMMSDVGSTTVSSSEVGSDGR